MRMSAATLMWPLMICGLAGIIGGPVPSVFGGLLTTPFALYDGMGPDAGRWRGSVTAAAVVGSASLATTVEWAAFAPGKFQDFLDDEYFGAVDISAVGEVVYAYQIVDVAAATPGLNQMTVGVDAGDPRGSVGPTFVPLTGGTAPTFADDQTNSMLWKFDTPLGIGDVSPILIFSSPFAPELDFIVPKSGVAAQLPPPLVASISDRIFEFEIPEPASVALLALGLIAVGSFRRRK